MKFKYKATRASGESFEAEGSFKDKFALYHELKDQGITPVVVEEVKEKIDFTKYLSGILSRVSMQDKIVFARNLGTMIKAGLSVSRTLSILERQTENKVFQKVIATVAADISKGQELSSALASHPGVFSPLFVSMVKAGEQSGTIADSLTMIASQMNDSYELTKRVRGALMYPGIILTLMLGIAILMLIYVIPSLTATFKELNVELPLPTRIILGTSGFFEAHYVIVLVLLAFAAAGIFAGLRTAPGRRISDWFALHL